ncbi:S9 family peptidase [Segatella bryantii]|jgi:dipeptidyl-peptidase-4|uniref:S9 family peptidase n=1 Tax=Segatella bryantii TaxID=77095 RepID=UPI001EDC3AFF|nr:S9 family peptidase [Segatella bryantii]UKK76927.1 S9 family peptidase [Segatella bryantii]
MKKIFILLGFMVMTAGNLFAVKQLDLKSITSGDFAAEYVSGIIPIKGSGDYAKISQDGRQIQRYSFKTGKQIAVLFDVSQAIGDKIDNFDGYIPSPDGKYLLIRTNTNYIYRRSYTADFYIYEVSTKKLIKLSAEGREQIPVWSPDSKHIAYVYQNNIFVSDLTSASKIQVTNDGKFNDIINGLPDWVNEEEFGYNKALVFNADGTRICWLKFDESQVKQYSLQMYKGSMPEIEEFRIYPGLYSYKYPKAGEDNSKVSAWSYDLKSKTSIPLNVPMDADGYMPRIKATNDAKKIVIYTFNRHQDDLRLYAVNPFTGISKLLIQEQVPKYVKEEAMEGIEIHGNHILLPSDRSGYMHLYLYDINGKLIRQVEKGNYDVTAVYGYDSKSGDVFYQAAKLNPHDRQIYVAHANGKIDRLSEREGENSAIFSGDFKYFINIWSDYNTPFVFTSRTRQGKVIDILEDNSTLKTKISEYGWVKKEPFTFTTSEGVRLDGWMVKPANFDAKKKYPVILFQYSGPGSQQVMNSWNSGSMGQGGAFDMYLAQRGYIIVCVDGRGTGGRGADFEKCTYLKLGELESRDQVETALYMQTFPYVDANRIGIWGWSFGGFNTLMSMSEGRGVFKAGVAVAPPTDWRFYDTVYTERYMRTPKENPTGYDTNPIQQADKLHGALLICHGTADDNVHPQNTFEYEEALVEADKDFKEVLYTNRNHSIRGGNSRNHLLRQISQFFEDNLR